VIFEPFSAYYPGRIDSNLLESGTENLVNYPGRIGTRVESAQQHKKDLFNWIQNLKHDHKRITETKR